MRLLFGVDFSADAKRAGEKIWLTQARLDGGVLRVHAVHPASELPGGGPGREQALGALRELVRKTPNAVFGFDFPFGLPRGTVQASTWTDFVEAFPEDHPDPEAFKATCEKRAGGVVKRRTDQEAGAPYSPYFQQMFRQTYHGICDLLHPLITANQAVVLPMQKAREGRPWLLEICPASTRQRDGLPGGYKGRGPHHRRAREDLLAALERKHTISLPNRDQRARILRDPGGVGLDSLIAAHAVARTITDPRRLHPADLDAYQPEGYVYV